jgi:hypothetical protein
MTKDEINTAILGAFTASWATATPIEMPNHQFNPPQGSWVRPTIKMGSSSIGELGSQGVGIRTGVVMVSIFTLKGLGSKPGSLLADRAEKIFRRKDISGISFNEPDSDDKGADDNGYWHTLMSVDFTTWIGE